MPSSIGCSTRRMDCGWGIRTYASGQPGYNPVGYHTGTVWPHDNALIAAGMKRVGRHDAADRVASRIFEAAQHSPDFRLPGAVLRLRPRDWPTSGPLPGRVLAAGVGGRRPPLSLLQTMLGMHADAAARRARARSAAPAGVARQGHACTSCASASERSTCCSIAGAATTTSAEVLRRDGPLELVIRV